MMRKVGERTGCFPGMRTDLYVDDRTGEQLSYITCAGKKSLGGLPMTIKPILPSLTGKTGAVTAQPQQGSSTKMIFLVGALGVGGFFAWRWYKSRKASR